MENLSDLKRMIIVEGDIDAYEKLSYIYMKDSNDEEVLIYSIIMANKYDYPRAYYDIFEALYLIGHHNDCYDYNLDCLDSETKKIALEYLKKAVMKGDFTASNLVLDFYGKEGHYPIPELYSDEKLISQALIISQNNN